MYERKVMRFNKLLFFFIVNCLFIFNIYANSISGQYSMPQKSVKFEKLENFSILPIGWSKDGNAAFLLYNREPWSADSLSGIKLIIMDTVEDKTLWLSPVYEINESAGIAITWNQNVDQFSEKLSEFNIIPQIDPQYGGTSFTLLEDEYKLFPEEIKQTGINGISSVSLKIESKNRGEKSLYKYVHSGESKSILIDFYVLGYFKSPWENRLAIVFAEDFLNENGVDSIQLKFSGAHMTIGYRRVESHETKLIDAVMSGQYYNSRNLLEKGAGADSIAQNGEPLVVLAAKQFNWDIVFLLLDFGADINQIDKLKRNSLHYAAINGDLSIVVRLLDMGADSTQMDSRGDDPESLAEKNHHGRISALLQ